MTTQQMSQESVKRFTDKLEAFSHTLDAEERHFLGVILQAAAAVGQDVQGYKDVDPTALDIGETASQVYYQYTESDEYKSGR